MNARRTWQVLLIGGASGVGKTNVSYRLAQHYGASITEVDDFQVILERMTTPEQQPVPHYWREHPDEARRMDEERQLAHMLSYSAVMATALELVIANHIESRAPIVLEGDFILPWLAVQPTYDEMAAEGQVRGLFLYEANEEQLRRNYRAREGEDQPGRARASWRHSEWLRAECARLGVPTIPARPWDTVLARAIAATGPSDVPALGGTRPM
jgi:2-phosphoglycerate kinase